MLAPLLLRNRERTCFAPAGTRCGEPEGGHTTREHAVDAPIAVLVVQVQIEVRGERAERREHGLDVARAARG